MVAWIGNRRKSGREGREEVNCQRAVTGVWYWARMRHNHAIINKDVDEYQFKATE
jgi:hypothetical protein